MNKKFSFVVLILLPILMISSVVISVASSANTPVKTDIEPTKFRAEVLYFTKVDEEKRVIYPAVQLVKMDYETGRLWYTMYEFPEFAMKIPDGYEKDEHQNWMLDGKMFHYGDLLQIGPWRGATRSVVIDDRHGGLKAYHVMSKQTRIGTEDKFEIEGKTLTILFSFDLNTKKLSIVNQLDSEDWTLGNVLPELNLYQMNNGSVHKYYSIDTHKFMFSSDSEGYPYKGEIHINEYFEPTPEIGDYYFPIRENYGDYLVVHMDGSQEVVEDASFTGQRNIGSLSIRSERTFMDSRNKITITQDGKVKELSQPNHYSYGYISPKGSTVLIYTSFIKGKEKLAKGIIELFNTATKESTHVITNYPKLGTVPSFKWHGESIVVEGQPGFNGEQETLFIHVPTGILTRKNDNIRPEKVLWGDRDMITYYNINPAEYLSLADPIEVEVKGIPIRYTGQGTFITEEDKGYVPIRDFITSIGGEMKLLEGNIVRVTYNQLSMDINLSDSNVIAYGGRSYIGIRDIALKLGFTIEFQKPNGSTSAKWKRYVLR